jgi:hypothetical protein
MKDGLAAIASVQRVVAKTSHAGTSSSRHQDTGAREASGVNKALRSSFCLERKIY